MEHQIIFPKQYIAGEESSGRSYKLDPLGKERLLKLAAFLDTLPPEQFDLSLYTDCGTVGCALGWCHKVFPEDWWVDDVYTGLIGQPKWSVFGAAEKYFGIGLDSVDLFEFDGYREEAERAEDVTPIMVAQHVRRFVEGLPCSD